MTTLSVADARARFSQLVDSAVSTHERFEVTRNGDRVAVLIGADDYDSLIETLDILSSSVELSAIRSSLDALADGDVTTAEEMRAIMMAAGRLPR